MTFVKPEVKALPVLPASPAVVAAIPVVESEASHE
jgi:hypothetical protein